MDVLKKLFERHFHRPAERVQPVQGDLGGSGRKIIRLASGDASAVGIVYDVRGENVAFLEFSRHFRSHGLPVPEIYGEDLNAGAYLEEDLGDTTLFQFLSQNRDGDDIARDVVEIYSKVVAELPRFQVEAGRDLNYKVCYPRGSFDRQSIAWDLNYFKYYFLKLADISFNEQELEVDFGRLTRFLLTAPRDYFLYRDFQSRNVMLHGGRPFFLDYQGGRKGALHYDIASLLFDAKADLPPPLRQRLLDGYLKRLTGFVELERDEFMRHYYSFVYVRIMQALGAYGFRGFYERKPHFLQSVPFALKNLCWLLENVELPIPLPTLLGAFQNMLSSRKLLALTPRIEEPSPEHAWTTTKAAAPASSPDKLVLRIFSFSFHRSAPPKDDGGHGGGFVFDARGLPNPGREERFKQLTGKDEPVIEYLEEQPSVHDFVKGATALVEASVKNYQERGFKSLMVSFGCTGGQHRSVYLAETMARNFQGRPGLEVKLRHLELEKLIQ
ncbi:MAG TPA: RNase adapter RapZ [Candidatus Angelobacter sp.]|jgi:aminoglycoside/choline kinase family phosphotransferase